ncbi:MAG: hypothetical protein O3C51_18445 [Planctomycetota bacterium]|nr:hypothetical protein [Planctomycetota bacterium]
MLQLLNSQNGLFLKKWSGEVFARAALADRAVLERAIDAAVDGFRELRTWPAW